jgi:protein-L-isoaspartate(D-aspartate) O-methyltransferase
VYSIELVPELAAQAKTTLKRLGYNNIHVRAGDGYNGWPEAAPFDAIVVTCGADHVPQPLVEQLKPGGRMIIPVGSFGLQSLKIIEKGPGDETREHETFPVRFVPLRRSADPAKDN